MFKTLLDAAIGGSTLPAHRGVENIDIHYPDTYEGFVVTYVPQAMNVPLLRLQPKDKQEFYIRAGSNFMPTPRAVLAGLFGRAPQADFEIDVLVGQLARGGLDRSASLNFQVEVRNCGRAIARDMFFNINVRFGSEATLKLQTFLIALLE